MEKNLRERIALKRWCELTGENIEEWTWERAKINAPMSTKSVLQEYDFYLTLFKEYVKGCELTDEEIAKTIKTSLGKEASDLLDYEWLATEQDKAVSHATISKVMEGLE